MSLNSAIGRFLAIFNRVRTALSDPQRSRSILVPMRHAGVYVDHETAMKFSAVYRAVAYISQTVAGLPWDVIRETDKITKLSNHPAAWLIGDRPNPELSAFAWRETMLAWALSWGNGYSEIEVDGAGRPLALWPLSPDRVQVKRNVETGQIVYEVSNYTGGAVYLPPDRMFHLHGLGYDGLQGYSVISMAARAIGLSQAAEMYAEDFFANGAVSTGALEHPGRLTDEAFKHLKESFEERHVKFGKKWGPLILEEDMTWKDMSISSRDAQMLEMRQFQVTDIARWFGIPPHKLADLTRATFSNITQQSIEVVNDALMPWVHRLEQEANYKLFTGRERGIRTKINVRGLLRGDDESRANYYKIMREIGVYSTNDILRLEDMNPIGPEGDERLVQLNLTTLKRLAQGDVQPSSSNPWPPQDYLRNSYMPLLEDAFERILKRESNRFDQNRHKFTQNGAFDAWIGQFLDQQKEYAAGVLEPILTGIALALLPRTKMNGNLSSLIASRVDLHIEATLACLRAVYCGQAERYEIAERAKCEAKDTIETVFGSLAGEKCHALSE